MDKKFDILTKIGIYKKNLIDTDYQAIKFMEGELTAEEYAPMKEQRKQWREQINALEIELQKIVDNAN